MSTSSPSPESPSEGPPIGSTASAQAVAPASPQESAAVGKPGRAAASPGETTGPRAAHRDLWIALLALLGLAAWGVLAGSGRRDWAPWPLWGVLLLGGLPLVLELGWKAVRGEFGSDLLAACSIITAVLLGEYVAATLVVLMLSGGQALEAFAAGRARGVLNALARRMPTLAHRKEQGEPRNIPLEEVRLGDWLLVFPHEICPVDGTVVEGHGTMDESYLTGEPYQCEKAPGTTVISGAINGQAALTIRADKLPTESRYARIMQVMRESEQRRPQIRRLADQLGAWYTPLALALAAVAWAWSGQATRFLAVLVVATPCPLLIAIPVAIIAAISLSARRGIIIRDPAVLEKIGSCRTAIFDKTGTLTCGEPELTEVLPAHGADPDELLRRAASLERYSKHPLSRAVLRRAKQRNLELRVASEVVEPPGAGLRGVIDGHMIEVTSRKKLLARGPNPGGEPPPQGEGLECVLVVDGLYAGLLRFRDTPRPDGARFVQHLGPRHQFGRVLLVSGDRASEVEYLARLVGITEVHASQTPEQKLTLVRAETARAPTLYVGDGINDAPALTAATVGLGFGAHSEITSEAAGAVVLDSSLARVDELLHIGTRMKRIALQSAVGGMLLSLGGMLFAAAGWLSPVAGALLQEGIDVLAVLNALRVATPGQTLTDYEAPEPGALPPAAPGGSSS